MGGKLTIGPGHPDPIPVQHGHDPLDRHLLTSLERPSRLCHREGDRCAVGSDRTDYWLLNGQTRVDWADREYGTVVITAPERVVWIAPPETSVLGHDPGFGMSCLPVPPSRSHHRDLFQCHAGLGEWTGAGFRR